MSKTQQLELARISTEGLQTRAALNTATVKEYAAAERDLGAVFPPVTVFLGPDGVYRLADGFHRLAVARRLGRKTIAAEVREGGFIDALKCALLANAAHGLRRTAADKRNAVMLAYKYRLELDLGEVPSANAVAMKVGVSNHFAGSQLGTFPSWHDAQTRTGADGRTRSLRSSALSLQPFPVFRPMRLCASALNSAFILQPSSFFRPPASALSLPPVQRGRLQKLHRSWPHRREDLHLRCP